MKMRITCARIVCFAAVVVLIPVGLLAQHPKSISPDRLSAAERLNAKATSLVKQPDFKSAYSKLP